MTEQKKKLLVVEDDRGLQKQIGWCFCQYDVVFAHDRESAITQLRRHEPPVVTLDLGLPPDQDGASEGLETLQQIIALAPDTKVIVITGNEERSNALQAISLGAYDFHQKPFDTAILGLVIERAHYLHAIQAEYRRLQKQQTDAPLPGLISRDPGILKMCRSVDKLAPTSASVMLIGDSGTGKELVAKALHQLSPRGGRRYMAINCAAIPEHLLESELFGYERGAFTGAVKLTQGKIELAHGGTFFLDEVGDLPMQLQAKLLRFLQERVIERVGGHKEIPVDVRVVCATHRNLKEMAREGRFREDLYYRLSEVVLHIPPLRERIGDSALLAHHFKDKFSAAQGRSTLMFSPDAMAKIESYSWPGNIREMENCIKRAVIMSEGPMITADDLGLSDVPASYATANLREVREQAEYAALVKVLARVDGNIVKAAEQLGISRPTLYDLMNRHGVRVVR